MPGLFVLGGEASITARDRQYAFAGLANTIDAELGERLPALDTPARAYLADDLAQALLEAYFEEPPEQAEDGTFRERARS